MRHWATIVAMAWLSASCSLFPLGPTDEGPTEPSSPTTDAPWSQRPCEGTALMSQSPVPLDRIRVIIPLGETGPPGHTLPVHHIYVQLTPPEQGAPLVAPGPGELVAVAYNAEDDDFDLHIRLCEDVRIYFYHLQSLDPELAAAVGSLDESDGLALGKGSVAKAVSVDLTPGTPLGTVGGPGVTSFDVGLIDEGRPPQPYVRPSRYAAADILSEFEPFPPNFTETLFYDLVPRRLQQFCPVDYFEDAPRAQLEARFGGFGADQPAMGDPLCQSHMRDVAGTMAGNWFVDPDQSQLLMDEVDTFAAVPYNIDPSIDTLSAPRDRFPDLPYDSVLGFEPTDTGRVNRHLAGIDDDQIHCFSDFDSYTGAPTVKGAFLLQLAEPDRSQLRAEYVDGETCTTLAEPWAFSGDAVRFYR